MNRSPRPAQAPFVASLCALATALPAKADLVRVRLTGVVEYNQVQSGELGLMDPSDPVTVSFLVDSDDYLDGIPSRTRGYPIVQDSFTLDAGAASLVLLEPQPATPYFAIRNNDPGVDGFFLSYGTDLPVSLELNQQGGFGAYGLAHSVTYNGARLSSLDILDAIGTYSFGYQSFHFAITDGPLDPAGFILFAVSIELVPCDADWNGDGTLDAFDYDDFVSAYFDHVDNGTGFPDYNGDGYVDAFDYDDFVSDFFTGCG